MNNNTTLIPPLLYGTAWKKERTAELVEKAIKYGFRGIDTACQPKHYNERGVGIALQQLKVDNIKRQNLFIQTKYTPIDGQDPNNIPYDPSLPLSEQVLKSAYTSLKNLNVEYLDALLLHSPLPTHHQTMQVWRSMEQLHDKSVVKMLGISNCYDLSEFQRLYEEAEVKPTILQNRFYSQTGYDSKLREYCLEKNVHYQSFWTLTANEHVLSHPILGKIAASKGVTEAQIFFRFLTQQHVIPLIGACSDTHMKEDLNIFNFTLSDAEIEKINSLLKV